ncbi:MAG: class I SAM-dependent methyltransferase [Chloroflexi bacterium]|nr:class I SAM-dependent methyltransferase [Chloroflexota bacterium]
MGIFVRIKPDWDTHLHAIRREELARIFGQCEENAFDRGLELGAGDGFQSTLLTRYVCFLVVSDYQLNIVQAVDTAAVAYRVCDAEQVGETFGAGEFDLVFSSNMLEHLPRPQAALSGIHRILRDDGVAIHVMPSVFWKLCQIALFWPNQAIDRIERYSEKRAARAEGTQTDCAEGNNPKVTARSYGYLRRLLWPIPHGAASSNWAELIGFRQARWRSELEAAGFSVAAVIPGPVFSGYGFGLNRVAAALERLKLASEYAYVTVKQGRQSPHLAQLARQTPARPFTGQDD